MSQTIQEPAPPAAPGVTDAEAGLASDDLPTSFGVFKPVGYVMLGLPTQGQADALRVALQGAGWPAPALRHFAPRESVSELQVLVDNSGPLSGFGYEIILLRRYLALAQAGWRWLLVKVDDTDHAAAACDIARAGGATLGVYYRSLTVEELI